MNDEHISNEPKAINTTRATEFTAKRRWVSFSIMLVALASFLVVLIADARTAATITIPVSLQGADRDYASFSHTSQRHASLDCAACHLRRDNSSSPSFPGHKACTDCHLTQFVTPSLPMCAICHTNMENAKPLRAGV